jgi:hypothetical protein
MWQVNLLTTVLNDSPVLPEEDDTPSMYRAIKEKDFYGNNNFWMLLFSNGKSSWVTFKASLYVPFFWDSSFLRRFYDPSSSHSIVRVGDIAFRDTSSMG